MAEAWDFTCLDRLEILRMNSPRSLKIGASRHRAGSLPCSVHSSFDTHPPDLARVSAGSTSGVSVSWGVSGVSEGTSASSSSVLSASSFPDSSDMAYPLFLLVVLLVLLVLLLVLLLFLQ